MTKKISIITPSFNQGAFIESTIQSVLRQNIPDLEYWVIDGGSNDQTIDILKKYDNQISWISEKDRGQAHAVNKGLQLVKGEIIGWLNSDDIYSVNAIRTVLDFFEAHPNIDIIYGNALFINEQGKVIGKYPTEPFKLKRLKETCFISQPAVFFRKKITERFGLLNEELNFCMDYEYWLRLATKGVQFTHLPNILAATRLHQQAKTCKSSLAAHEESLKMIRTYTKHISAYRILAFTKTEFEYKANYSRDKSKIKQLLTNLQIGYYALIKSLQLNGIKGLVTFFLLPKAYLKYLRARK